MSPASIPDVLARIVEAQIGVVAAAKQARSVADLREQPGYALPRHSLVDSLSAKRPGVICECKRRSPSRGILRDPYDAAAIARGYEAAGAAGISVLTNEEFFGGTLEDLRRVRDVVAVPLLRKDFVIDEYQLEEARAAGADAALLIASVLDPVQLRDFAAVASGIGLEVLVEIHDAPELAGALDSGARLIGINNRNLHNFVTDLATTEALAPDVPPDRIVVAESGLREGADLRRLGHVGVHAFLVGEAFMQAEVPGDALGRMLAEAAAAEAG
ncbi:MAG: indole-3-glycerol phosphate synthase TrpC [Deltaproteobacteria bacterium]